MLKVSTFAGETDYGPSAVPLFGSADKALEKTAARLLPDVVRYIDGLRPQTDAQYVLVNAMGASEFYGSNINGDAFPEASLIHAPDDWKGNPLVDRVKAQTWPYGYPTFYLAHPYAHHRNKDASRAFGNVELAVWHPNMRRVELVVRVDKDKCEKFGGIQVWDKLKNGQFPDVSMGTKVPFDTCSICLDWDLYRKAQATFIPGKDKHPGDAVLRWHKAKKAKDGTGIRGVSITRADYCEHAKRMMNRILPDGRKVFVFNDYPRFFDISFVFIGADRTAKTMMKIAGDSRMFFGSAELAEKLGYDETDEVLVPAFVVEQQEKVASVDFSDPLKLAFIGKDAKDKEGEILKDVVPSQFAAKAVPVLTKHEDDLPEEILEAMSSLPSSDALSTASGLGIVLRPHEFDRVTEDSKEEKLDLSADHFHHGLASLLLPLLMGRSMLGPFIERRVIVVVGKPSKGGEEKSVVTPSHSSTPLRKMSSAYDNYRQSVMNLVAHSQDLISEIAPPGSELAKLANAPAEQLFTPLSVAYIKEAFRDEPATQDKIAQARATVERAAPSKNTMSAFNPRRIQ
jgi:hypothetical protein